MYKITTPGALMVAALCGLMAINVAVAQQAAGQAPPRLQLQHDCFVPELLGGYVQPPKNCTCSRSTTETAGHVQWSWANGTLLPQMMDSSNTSATVVVESPMEYAKNVTLLCSLVGVNGSTSDQIEYTAKLLFGPEDTRLITTNGAVHLCSNGSRVVTLYCDVLADTVNPFPMYTVFVNGEFYKGYYLRGDETVVDGRKFFRLEISFPVTKTGNYIVTCHVRNVYSIAYWSMLTAHFTVLAEAPGIDSC